ncbi:hypothetical protein HaLaN_12651 [Haematococcus lacustris]|uniref:Uncharacterized protein n=1 Tax=Haematococcus lacustris TaxID=44745 RepID=A0A699Z3Y1_HAELA|nr:hypothetical protein HaLaN_12651 [Haematococcus lacustris]
MSSQPVFAYNINMVLGTKAMEVKWLERWGRRWVGFEGDPRLPETVHRERCSYAAWFKHGDGIGINHMAPHLLNRQLSTEVRTSLTRFRKSRTPRGGGRPSSLTADGLSGVSHIILQHLLHCGVACLWEGRGRLQVEEDVPGSRFQRCLHWLAWKPAGRSR